MIKKNLTYTLIGSSLVAAFILACCNAAATPTASASATATRLPNTPTPTFTTIPTVTETPTPLPTATPLPTSTEPPTPTLQLTPQVNPGMNAYCRKGPGTGYYPITFLQEGTPYDVIGQNGLNTWWLIQIPGSVTCWMGDPMAVMLGPIWQVPIVLVPHLPQTPSSFDATYECHSALNIFFVSFSWLPQTDVLGYHLYRNGILLKDIGPNAGSIRDNSPPFGVDVVYVLEGYTDLGVSDPVTVTIPFCGG